MYVMQLYTYYVKWLHMVSLTENVETKLEIIIIYQHHTVCQLSINLS